MMLTQIRERMNLSEIDAYVISYGNRFLGQDVLSEEHKLSAVCGFSGSAGALAITKDKAFLVVDGRYELQAQKQVDNTKFQIINSSPRLKTLCDLLSEENIKKIGYNAWNYSVAEMEFIKRRYRNFDFIDTENILNLNTEKVVKIYNRDIKYAGLSRAEKISLVLEQTAERHADYILLTSADSISWLLNIYCNDLPYSPVVRAYALLDKSGNITLFGENIETDVNIKSWKDFISFLQSNEEKVILYDPHTTPEKFKNNLNPATVAVKTDDPCQKLKSVKNPAELTGMINCHIRDGVALCKLLYWLQNNYKDKTEIDVVKKLHDFRSKQDLFFSESFATIAGFGANGAIVHYQPTVETDKKIEEGNLLLIDSGGQYLDGTTDVTRTVAIGKPDKNMKHDFTYVLKAHIALASAVFPRGTSGFKIDTLARAQLWSQGLEYKHGTGHGVACFGNVHEGPISISLSSSFAEFYENMITSIEPGVYKENKYGIRIENLFYTSNAENITDFLEFIPLTLAPIDKNLIEKSLLDNKEIDWLNNYHREVYEKISPLLNSDEQKWLENACLPL